MIIDNLKNAHLYYALNEKIKLGLEFLTNTDLNVLEAGRYEIDGKKVFAIVQNYETKEKNDFLWESHRKFIDIQYVVEGQELIGYTPVSGLKSHKSYDSEKDIEFFEGTGDFFLVKAGTFAIFAPQDAHMPSILVNDKEKVKKIVIKLEV